MRKGYISITWEERATGECRPYLVQGGLVILRLNALGYVRYEGFVH